MKDYSRDYCDECGERWLELPGGTRIHACGPKRDKASSWAYTPLGFVSLVLMMYLLLWLATGLYKRHVDCWALEGSMGCVVIWEGAL